MPELLRMAPCRKDWKRVSAELSRVSPQQPSQLGDWTELRRLLVDIPLLPLCLGGEGAECLVHWIKLQTECSNAIVMYWLRALHSGYFQGCFHVNIPWNISNETVGGGNVKSWKRSQCGLVLWGAGSPWRSLQVAVLERLTVQQVKVLLLESNWRTHYFAQSSLLQSWKAYFALSYYSIITIPKEAFYIVRAPKHISAQSEKLTILKGTFCMKNSNNKSLSVYYYSLNWTHSLSLSSQKLWAVLFDF